MTQIVRSTPPKVGNANGMSAMIGLGIGLLIFLLLPVAQWLDAITSKHETTVEYFDNPPPPPMQVMENHPEDKAEDQKLNDLKEQPPPPSLDMLELSLSGTLSGIGVGDVAIPTFDIAGDLNNMIFDLKDLDERPTPISQAKPQHPLDLRQAGINGEVVVQFLVDSHGSTRNIKIVSSTNVGFNEPTIRAIRTWKFKPGKKNGQAVTTRVQIPINFKAK